uniref:GRIP domain-containing protein n=1 Tax=Arion vulgaris TaxID=1028688 RepID=A0A0B7B1U7_9EUPU
MPRCLSPTESNNMDKASRTQLLDTITNQKEQLLQYKAKLRDVVAAYKSVVKEKEAVEASFTALSVSTDINTTDETDDGKLETSLAEDGARRDEADPLGINKQEVKDDTKALMEKIKTLSLSLTTLSQEKNKIEANFIAERKHLRHEHEMLVSQLADEKNRTHQQAETLELHISDLKSRIRSLQLEREREQADHAVMLRELQSLLAKERSSKDAIESQLEEVQHALRESQHKTQQELPVVSEVYEQQIQQLQRELVTVRDRLKSAENKANQPSPFIIELQKEMGSMKADYQTQVEKEQKKATEAESRLRLQSKQNEERVSSLEAKLSELSQVVGNYERLRFQDQHAINKLRERVTQLDMENTALSRAANLTPEKADDEDNLETEQLLSKIMHFRSLLKAAAEKSEKPINLSSIFVEDMNKADEESPLCRQYKEELEHVRKSLRGTSYELSQFSRIRTRILERPRKVNF